MEGAAKGDKRVPMSIKVPPRTLLVLCGPAGSGKSTFAAQRFGRTVIVSSDHCRELICDDANNQQVNRDAFDLFYFILKKRMFLGRFSVADSTALYADARRRLRDMAHWHGYFACLLIFNISQETCARWNEGRERRVEDKVHPYHATLLQQALRDAPNEGWDGLHILGEASMDAVVEILTQ